MEAIEALRPADDVPPRAPAWRPFRVLFLRYIETLDTIQIAEQLAISPRQVRREHSRGVDMVVDILWDRYRQASDQGEMLPGEEDSPATESLLDAAVSRLGLATASALTPLPETIQGAIAVVSGLATGKGVRLLALPAVGLPPVAIDRVVLRQVLLNVLTHLLDNMAGGALELRAEMREGKVAVTVEVASGRTKPDLQSDRMLVAQHLLEMQEGQLWGAMTSTGKPAVHVLLPVLPPTTVLVIDDDQDMLRLFQRYLGGGSYQVVTATSGEEALRVVSELPLQAITLDVMMPSQDGWEVLQLLKNHPATQHVPIIVCSVLRERDLALSLGAAEFLPKPVTQMALLAALAHCGAVAGPPGQPADNASTPQSKGLCPG